MVRQHETDVERGTLQPGCGAIEILDLGEMADQHLQRVREVHGPQFKRELCEWLQQDQGQGELMVAEVLRCLEEVYLLSLPFPKGVQWPTNPGPRNFRFLFRRQVARLLGWTERRVEGEANSFSEAVNRGLRVCWWPDEEPMIERRSWSPPLQRQAQPLSVQQIVRMTESQQVRKSSLFASLVAS